MKVMEMFFTSFFKVVCVCTDLNFTFFKWSSELKLSLSPKNSQYSNISSSLSLFPLLSPCLLSLPPSPCFLSSLLSSPRLLSLSSSPRPLLLAGTWRWGGVCSSCWRSVGGRLAVCLQEFLLSVIRVLRSTSCSSEAASSSSSCS